MIYNKISKFYLQFEVWQSFLQVQWYGFSNILNYIILNELIIISNNIIIIINIHYKKIKIIKQNI